MTATAAVAATAAAAAAAAAVGGVSLGSKRNQPTPRRRTAVALRRSPPFSTLIWRRNTSSVRRRRRRSPLAPPPPPRLRREGSLPGTRSPSSSHSPVPEFEVPNRGNRPCSSRRSVQKRVVSIPIAEAEGSRSKGGVSDGGGAPPSDSWAWRKYGQKPIKGSPYPRGYYRCSSSKGCPARKQVERSRADPSLLVITYACEHNHPWPLPKNHQQQQQKEGIHRRQPSAAAGSPSKPALGKQESEAIVSPPPATSSSPSSAGDGQIFAADLSLAMMADEFGWFSDVSASPPAGDAFLGGPIGDGGALMIPPAVDQETDDFAGSEGAAPEEEEALFAGLGELPECAVVFRRGFLDRQIRMQIDGKDDRLLWRMREKELELEIEREGERGCVAASR
ncbi:unnamed protein product [Spirodela intermedia]|uniref:WRKY domain-containing protein n=1 Tax=Spirodela intermedia TaxID=51605 RepID=A0A7I8LJK8_SPIIN|nr:unnamed protein product [Spirodela intermedia]